LDVAAIRCDHRLSVGIDESHVGNVKTNVQSHYLRRL
jgi:hypothetical protein